MNRITIAFLTALLVSLKAYAFDNITRVASDSSTVAMKSTLAKDSLLLDIKKISDKKLVAVGEYGHILTSNDGVNWLQASVPVQTTLTSVYFYDEALGWAVGHDATILHSQDGGNTWNIQHYQPELEKPLLDVSFKSALEGIAVGAYGMVFRTLDGGKSWTNEFHPDFLLPEDKEYLDELKQDDEAAYLDEISFILPHFNRLVKDGRTLFLLGEAGLMAKSNDFGLHWQMFDDIYQGSFFDLGRTESGNLLVAGLRGHVFRGIQNGLNWTASNTNTTALLSDIILGADERIFIIGNNGTLLVSDDDGETFTARPQSDGKALISGVWFNNQLVAVSEVGIKVLDLPTVD